jgi:large subunit ribosomal protein L13e
LLLARRVIFKAAARPLTARAPITPHCPARAQHYRKEWDRRVKTWLDQPARKVRRREARKSKAAAAAPRPVGLLRPTVRGQSARYNAKAKQGRGFSLAELRAAGLTAAAAGTIGIAVDHRRINKSEESLAANKARLAAYLATVVVAKRKAKGADQSTVPTIGTSTTAAGGLGGKAQARVRGAPRATLGENEKRASRPAPAAAVKAPGASAPVEFVAVTAELKKAQAYRTLRQEWINMRLVGKREKAKKEKAEAAAKATEKKPDE